MEEIWKDIRGYEGIYQISNLGRVKSLQRQTQGRWGIQNIPEKIIKCAKNAKGYLHCRIGNKTYSVHTLVWDYFGDEPRNKITRQIDHIDQNKANNYIGNLQLLSNRQNCIKRSLNRCKTSRFSGVRLDKRKKYPYWTAQIYKGGKIISLGAYSVEALAGLAYQKALISLGEL